MDSIALNLLSGLFGALIGAIATMYSVRILHMLQCQSVLRKLLVEQRVQIDISDKRHSHDVLKEGFLKIYQSYEDLLCSYGFIHWIRRKSLKKYWTLYKGDSEPNSPRFTKHDNSSGTLHIRPLTFEENCKNIENLLIVIK